MNKNVFMVVLMTMSPLSFSEGNLLSGKSNFGKDDIKSAISILTSKNPMGKSICSNVDKIFSKIVEQKEEGAGKTYSKEQWRLSGCDGATSVAAILYPSGLVKIRQ